MNHTAPPTRGVCGDQSDRVVEPLLRPPKHAVVERRVPGCVAESSGVLTVACTSPSPSAAPDQLPAQQRHTAAVRVSIAQHARWFCRFFPPAFVARCPSNSQQPPSHVSGFRKITATCFTGSGRIPCVLARPSRALRLVSRRLEECRLVVHAVGFYAQWLPAVSGHRGVPECTRWVWRSVHARFTP